MTIWLINSVWNQNQFIYNKENMGDSHSKKFSTSHDPWEFDDEDNGPKTKKDEHADKGIMATNEKSKAMEETQRKNEVKEFDWIDTVVANSYKGDLASINKPDRFIPQDELPKQIIEEDLSNIETNISKQHK